MCFAMLVFVLCAAFLFLGSVASGMQVASAVSETDIEIDIKGEVLGAKFIAHDDLSRALSPPRCGGLMSATDERVWAYYARREKLQCNLEQWCTQYEREKGLCIGQRCTLVP